MIDGPRRAFLFWRAWRLAYKDCHLFLKGFRSHMPKSRSMIARGKQFLPGFYCNV